MSSLREQIARIISDIAPCGTLYSTIDNSADEILRLVAEHVEGMPRVEDAVFTKQMLEQYPGTIPDIDIDYELSHIVADAERANIVTELKKE